ncbi:hypothetical protein JNW91_26720 [Micromonospora sp. STR1_7]|uniref:CHAP domain-containing protein n=1 Tax=Micromonospora parastrephiae TaxID=2806101 RepID=A0ABS1Y0P2_9ACTN|nr:hypothetical protein [Micromonospora parastrephiae]MBM0235081.1 hypothetical protein [Micromonospora parastrephiae]
MWKLLDVSRPRAARRIVIAATLAAVAVGTTPGVAQAYASSASGTVNTAGTALSVRSGPGATYDSWRTVADGATVTLLCQTTGQSVTGTYGTTTTWDFLSNGGMVSDAYVYTGSDGQVVDSCVYVGDEPSSKTNPRSANGAIDWAFQRNGSTSYENLCLAFVAQAYGWGGSGWNTAEIGGDWESSHGYLKTSGIPPRGALVWYHNSVGSGHVAISLGEGKVIGTSVGGGVGVAGYLDHDSYRGWSVAYLPAAW